MNLRDLKTILKNLRDDNIFDYESGSSFYKIFTSFYNKKEAIDFLLCKINHNIHYLKDRLYRLVPTNRSISIKDIDNTIDCLFHFQILIKDKDLKIIEYIKNLNEKSINTIIYYSNYYSLIIELNVKDEKDIFENIHLFIYDIRLTFKLDNEISIYKIESKNLDIDIEELINLKNNINIQLNDKNKIENKNKEDLEMKRDIYHELIFFKKIVSNIEVIYNKIKILRKKGYNVPILIDIVIRYPEYIYKFNNKEEKDFNFIKNYLSTIINFYEEQLDIIYQSNKYLRFLYGKLFRKIKLHQEGNYEVNDIIRYILNKKEYDDKIIDGDIIIWNLVFHMRTYIKNIIKKYLIILIVI